MDICLIPTNGVRNQLFGKQVLTNVAKVNKKTGQISAIGL